MVPDSVCELDWIDDSTLSEKGKKELPGPRVSTLKGKFQWHFFPILHFYLIHLNSSSFVATFLCSCPGNSPANYNYITSLFVTSTTVTRGTRSTYLQIYNRRLMTYF